MIKSHNKKTVGFTIALIGTDGAGKTTIARMLLRAFPMPIKYLYMGTSILSSNIALPTSRLILNLKLRAFRKSAKSSGRSLPESISNHDLEYGSAKRGKIGAIARTIHRLSEEWFRQAVSWYLQMCGYIVLYDRHFIFEYTPGLRKRNLRISDRIHMQFLDKWYPRPDLVLFLDAPASVLICRKMDCSAEHLERQRRRLHECVKSMDNVVRIDASRPLPEVYNEVFKNIVHHIRYKYPNRLISAIDEKLEGE